MAKAIKKLYRSKKDRRIAGVCGGLAEYFGVDSTIVRLIYAVLLVFTAIMPLILVYLLLWIIIPEAPK